MKKIIYLIGLALTGDISTAEAQDSFNYSLGLNPVTVDGLPGLHSYAFAQHEGKWLIIGGRRDGIHARQPFNAFPENQNNTDVFVVDVEAGDLWTGSLNGLPISIREQLQSTNMNFYQSGDTLYIVGGYSYAASAEDHITHPKLTSIIVSETMDAIVNNNDISPYFQQIEDDIFANTGGQMGKIDDFFCLIGGHRFDGRYNPMGNPTFTQEYKTMIQKFKLHNAPGDLSFSMYSFEEDPIHLRRRDYNLVPQIFPDGSEGYMISSGVFQINADLPFLYPVDVTTQGYTPNTGFNQYLSHYHGAKTSIYDEEANETHMLFYGGMSQYYYENGDLVQDNNVPFVKTISRVTRYANGDLQEFLLPLEMPALQGAGSEFIPNKSIAYTQSKVLRINEVSGDSILLGHMYGGIQTDLKNPFASNQTNQTSADATIYEIWLVRNAELGILEVDGKNPYEVAVFPNPTKNKLTIQLNGENVQRADFFITSMDGKIVQKGRFSKLDNGKNQETIQLDKSLSSNAYLLTVVVNNKFYLNARFIKD
jgi:hypothetical protein